MWVHNTTAFVLYIKWLLAMLENSMLFHTDPHQRARDILTRHILLGGLKGTVA
jgi:hypothetical protein